jgi:hypothetical protein
MVYRRSKDPAHSCLIRSAAISYRTRTYVRWVRPHRRRRRNHGRRRIFSPSMYKSAATSRRRRCVDLIQLSNSAGFSFCDLSPSYWFRPITDRSAAGRAMGCESHTNVATSRLRLVAEGIARSGKQDRFSCCCTHGAKKFRFHVDWGKRQTIAADSGLCIVRSMEGS